MIAEAACKPFEPLAADMYGKVHVWALLCVSASELCNHALIACIKLLMLLSQV